MTNNNLQQVKQQTSEARRKLEIARGQSQQVKSQLELQKEQLPEIRSQKALRQTMSGLAGREQRRVIAEKERELGTGISQVQEYETKTLQPYEREVQRVEGEIQKVEEDIKARETAQKLFDKGVWSGWVKGAEYKYLRQLERGQSLQREQFFKKVGELQSQLPSGEKIIVDWEKREIKGVSSDALKMSLPTVDGKIQYGIKQEPQLTPKITLPTISQFYLGSQKIDLSKDPSVKSDLLMNKLDLNRTSILSTTRMPSQVDYFSPLGTRSTRTDLQPQLTGVTDKTVYAPGTIYSVQKGDIKGTPTFDYFYVDEKTYETKKATQEQIQLLEDFQKQNISDEVSLKEKPSRVRQEFGELTGRYSKFREEPFFISPEEITKIRETGDKFGVPGKVASRTFIGLIPKTRGEVLDLYTTFGLTGGLGYVGRGGTLLLGQYAPRVATGLTIGGKVAGIGLGGLYVKTKVGQIASAEGYDKFEVLGATGREIIPGYLGFRAGVKGAESSLGYTKFQKPEVSIGFERIAEDRIKLLVASREKGSNWFDTRNLRRDTISTFDVRRTGEGTFQITGGKGASRIFRGDKPLSTKTFTFYGDADKTSGRFVNVLSSGDKSLTIQSKATPEPFKIDVKTLIVGGKKQTTTRGFGFTKQDESGVSKILTGDYSQTGFRLTGGTRTFVDGRTGTVREIPFGTKTGRAEFKGAGMIKRVSESPSRVDSFSISSGRTRTITSSITKQDITSLGGLTSDLVQQSVQVTPSTRTIPFVAGGLINVQDTKIGLTPTTTTVQTTPIREESITTTQVISQAQDTKESFGTISGTRTLTIQKSKQTVIPAVKSIEAVAEISKQGLLPATAQKFKQAQKQKTVTSLMNVLKTGKATTKITQRTVPPVKIGFDLDGTLKKAKRKLGDEESFKVFVKKFGEDVEAGEFGTLEEAKGFLTSKLRKTLRAGGFIQRGGTPIKARELGLFGAEFRPSKSDPFRIIERKTRRLKKGGTEVREIIGFRGSSSKSKKNLFKL